MNIHLPPPRPWLASYQPGVPEDIDPSTCPTLVDLLETAFQQHADRDFALFMDEPIGFAEVDRQSRDLGAFLQGLGLAPGARVALMMPNIPPYLVAIAAVLRAGCTVVNVNPLYTPRELQHQLEDSGAEVIVLLENFAHTLEQVLERTPVRHVVLVAMGDMLRPVKRLLVNLVVRHVRKLVPPFRLPRTYGRTVTRYGEALRQGRHQHLAHRPARPDDIAFLQYTGGTTGVAKGAMLQHRHVVANILQTEAWFRPTLLRLGPRQLTAVCALPLYHIFALTVSYFMSARLGSRMILIPNPRDLPALIQAIGRHRIHLFPAVNTLYNALANHPDFARLDFSELVVSNGGGMAVQKATADRWLAITGCPIAEGYGLSETSPVVTANRLDVPAYTGSIGLPLPGTDVSIRDDDGRELPPGQPGEICIRGPQVMAGYWNRPEETAEAMTADGYFRSGDIGTMDEQGQFRIVDRKKDMILVSGFNVYPTEIEQVVNQHPGVLECAVVGIPDEHTGEAVKLFVVRKDPSLDEPTLRRHCQEQLTGYKRPRHIEFRTELPKSTVGKILRRELRPS
ncbi:long-chain acyl-CoA synthetase [Sphaerotilus hippei]|uniref:Long-chain-fatty-acid--CoA ligase n=1 Tax=Sphaerotilus hippei TaxID=744406 RepID=A0A318H8P1_9BURK|nr:long-chain-fatty-acid--CoA ligase [Sphaerotilus hippei]PXW99268.1 long-chain acyl-CoA synthetase [Sphaerotilus hippei]